jgi:hypothetical protein
MSAKHDNTGNLGLVEIIYDSLIVKCIHPHWPGIGACPNSTHHLSGTLREHSSLEVGTEIYILLGRHFEDEDNSCPGRNKKQEEVPHLFFRAF